MTKAKRVHSTPRRCASKVQHPPATKPAKVTDAAKPAGSKIIEQAVIYVIDGRLSELPFRGAPLPRSANVKRSSGCCQRLPGTKQIAMP
jgi:hypothetical protein